MDRRTFLSLVAAAVGAAPATAQTADSALRLGAPVPFDPGEVIERARALAAAPWQERRKPAGAWGELSYEQYRSIWFAERNALWNGTAAPLRVDFFPPGPYFTTVTVNAVEDGMSRPVLFDLTLFDRTDAFPDMPIDDATGFSGVRLRVPLEVAGINTEVAVFQGASYFRAIGAGEVYGASARGLAIDTAEPTGEEFPDFTDFWIVRPSPDAAIVTVYALLDSPSATGAYRFDISPGPTTRMDVTATIFARERLVHVGLAPLTSMFLFDETVRDRFSDFRPAVHDNDGLLIWNGAGEVLWRPLANPKLLQISGFIDDSPRGFGLMQRARRFDDFADLESRYDKRPGVWITPVGAWGKGTVTLVEIPTDREIFDNIVCYWRPLVPLGIGEEREFAYRIDWGDTEPETTGAIRVENTRIGGHPDGGIVVAIDYANAGAATDDLGVLTPEIRASAGTTGPGVLQRNPGTGGPRLAFTFQPGDAQVVEFRVALQTDSRTVSEIWIYRWTA